VNTGANGFDRMADSQAACPGRRLAWLIIRQQSNWQLPVANGCLIWRPVLPDLACGSGMGVKKRAGQTGFSGRQGEISPK